MEVRVRKSLDRNSNGNLARIHDEGAINGVLKPSETAKNGEKPGLDKALWIVFTSLVVDLLAFTVILPLLPSLLEFYGNKEVRPFS